MSKNARRKARRAAYYEMLDKELDVNDRSFRVRVIRTMDHGGMDVAPDGRPIPADFWRYRDSRRQDPNRVRAIEYSVAGAVRSIQVRPSGLQRPLPLDMVKRVGR